MWHLHKKVHCRSYISVSGLLYCPIRHSILARQSLKEEHQLHQYPVWYPVDLKNINSSLLNKCNFYNSYFLMLFSSHLPTNNTVNLTINENDWVSFSPLLHWTPLWKDQPALFPLILTCVEPMQTDALSRTSKQSRDECALLRTHGCSSKYWSLLSLLYPCRAVHYSHLGSASQVK